MSVSHASVHPVEAPPLQTEAANVPRVRMKDIQGMPGTISGLFLRFSQFVFAAVALAIMASTGDFSSVTAFCYLVAAAGLQVLWSFSLGILDIYALLVGRTLQNQLIVSIFAVGDGSMAGEMTVAVVIRGEDTAPKTATLSGGGVWSKVSRKVMNVMSFIRGLKSGRNREVAPPRKDAPGSGEEENPIVEMMEKQELGKAVFMLAVPMSTGLVFFKSATPLSPTAVHFTLVANVAGCTAIWNGLLLRKTCSRIATVVEQAGVGSVFLGFNVLVGNYLPPELRFVPAICWGFSVLPFLMAAVPGGGGGGGTDLQGGKEEDIFPV